MLGVHIINSIIWEATKNKSLIALHVIFNQLHIISTVIFLVEFQIPVHKI